MAKITLGSLGTTGFRFDAFDEYDFFDYDNNTKPGATGVKIYAVGVGSEGMAPVPVGFTAGAQATIAHTVPVSSMEPARPITDEPSKDRAR